MARAMLPNASAAGSCGWRSWSAPPMVGPMMNPSVCAATVSPMCLAQHHRREVLRRRCHRRLGTPGGLQRALPRSFLGPRGAAHHAQKAPHDDSCARSASRRSPHRCARWCWDQSATYRPRRASSCSCVACSTSWPASRTPTGSPAKAIRTRGDVRRRLADPPEDALCAVAETVSRSRAAPDQAARREALLRLGRARRPHPRGEVMAPVTNPLPRGGAADALARVRRPRRRPRRRGSTPGPPPRSPSRPRPW